ncbi:MAG: substrate-binding domain-containing protein [Candidatus Aminicenantes bacterium]|nr:substrate-binding domain-containing protein [Candidatus Aminicenantes bacterium]
MKKSPVCLLAVSLVIGLCLTRCGTGSGPPKPSSEETIQIAVIPKGTTHEFWKAIHAGAVKAAGEMGVEIFWKGPQKEDDRAQQIQVVEDFVSRGVDGIVLAPLDDRALMIPVRDATREGIPVVIIDSDLQGEEYISFVATDNYKGGVLAARAMGDKLREGGRIFLVRYQEGSASTTKRETGFLDTITAEYPKISIMVQDLFAGATTETAFQLGENLLSRFPDVDGIFCPNESTTFGMLRALQESGRAGQVAFIGFDSSPKLVAGLSNGEIHGLVLQDPVKIGYLGVKQMVLHLRGQFVESRVDTGVYLATPENMNEPLIQSLLSPELADILEK